MRMYVSGGCKNGKSTFAQDRAVEMALAAKRAKAQVPLYYVATMAPRDEEDRARIRRHREERKDLGFTTLEKSHYIREILEETVGEGVFLLDSVTALLANEMFDSREPYTDGGLDTDAPVRVADELMELAEECRDIVMVSDYLYGGGSRYDELTVAYMEGLAYVDRCLAAACDRVVELASGLPIYYKGGPAEKGGAGK